MNREEILVREMNRILRKRLKLFQMYIQKELFAKVYKEQEQELEREFKKLSNELKLYHLTRNTYKN